MVEGIKKKLRATFQGLDSKSLVSFVFGQRDPNPLTKSLMSTNLAEPD